MSRLEKITNVCIVAACVAITGDVATRAWARTTAVARAPMPAEYKVGDRLEEVKGLRPTTTRSLVMVVRSTCTYCTQSLPFYQRMTQAIQSAGAPVTVNAVCTEAAETCAKYLDKAGIKVDQVIGVDPAVLKVAGTPTLVLLGADGRVSQVWKGLLDEAHQDEVLSAVLGKAVS